MQTTQAKIMDQRQQHKATFSIVADEASIVPAIDNVDVQAQSGVQDMEAITITWTKTALILAYVLIWCIYFVEGMLSATVVALSPYVTSDFIEQPLLPTVTIVSSIIAGVSNFTIAKILDVFGRPQGLLLCICIAVVGLVMMVSTNGVETYAAAQVFYSVGNFGLQYTLSVLVSDTSSLKNRGLMQAIASSPYLITCWLAGPIATGFLSGPGGWQWAFGMFTILIPAVTLPLYVLLFHNYKRARKSHILPSRERSRTLSQSVCYHLKEFDALGLLFLSSGAALFLLPFSLYTIQSTGWSSPLIICLLVTGVALLVAFVIWERCFAPITFMPWNLLKDRMVFGACMLSAAAFFSNACWASYFPSFLQVVADMSITNASYITQIGTVGSVLASLAAGILIHYTGRFKKMILYFAIPLCILGTGLMITFRKPDQYIGYIVMCQVLIAVANGFIVVCDEIAILAATSQQYIAISLAIVGLSGSIGSALGGTVAAAIWQGMFSVRLLEYLPAEALNNFDLIYGDLNTQLSYDVGTPTRIAIQQAYGETEQYLLIVATAVWAVALVAVLFWCDIKVSDIKQVKGQVV